MTEASDDHDRQALENAVAQRRVFLGASAVRASQYFRMVAELCDMGDDRMARLILDHAHASCTDVIQKSYDLQQARKRLVEEVERDRQREPEPA